MINRTPSNLTKNIFVFGAIAFVAAVLYANTLNSPFMFDDLRIIPENPHIRLRALSVDSIMTVLTTSGYRPLPVLSFALNYRFGGYNPFGYHFVNIVIHVITGFLLFLFFKATLSLNSNLTEERTLSLHLPFSHIAFLAALIWTVHPVNTQSVTYIVQRMNSMSAMFCLLSLYLYIVGRTSGGKPAAIAFTFAILSWIFAIASKQNAAILPLIIFIYEWFFFQDLNPKWLKRSLKYLLAITMICIILGFIFLGRDPIQRLTSLRDFSEGDFTYIERVLTQPRVIVHYISLFFFPYPQRLNLDYNFPLSHSLVDPVSTLFSTFALSAILAFGLFIAKKNRIASFCILWFFINLAVESSFIPLAVIFEHRTYMPYMGLALLTVLVIDRYFTISVAKYGTLSLLILVAAVWTIQRNEVWKSPITLWQDTIEKSPGKTRLHLNLGAAYEENGDLEKAAEEYYKAIDLDPDYAEAYNNLGNVYIQQEKLHQAEAMFNKALQIRPTFVKAHHNIATLLRRLGRPDEAIQHLKEALRLMPEFSNSYLSLANIYSEQGKKEEALSNYRKALQYDPEIAAAHFNIGKILIERGDTVQAESQFRKALQIDPSSAEAAVNLGNIAQNRGDKDAAMDYYQKALASDPENANAHYNMARLLIQSGDAADAQKHLEEALQFDDELVEAHVSLGYLLEEKGETQEALAHYRKALELDPAQTGAQNNIGNILAKQEKYEAAIPYYREAIRLDPKFEDARVNLGIALLRLGDTEGARKQFEEALRINPSNPGARQGMEILQSAAHLTESASPEELHQKALDHARKGEYQAAVDRFKEILAIIPSEPGTCYNIACMYAKMGDSAAALEWLARAIQNGYDNWDAIENDPDLKGIRQTEGFKALLKKR